MTIQPARHESHACCPLRAGFVDFQPVVDNTRGTRVEQVVSSFQKILRGSQLTWYIQENILFGIFFTIDPLPYHIIALGDHFKMIWLIHLLSKSSYFGY